MEKYTKKLLIFTVLLLIVTFIVVFFNTKTNTLGTEGTEFEVNDTLSITNIRINQKFEITKKSESNWLINHQIEADRESISQLFYIINHTNIKAPIAQNEEKRVEDLLAQNGTILELFEDSKLIKKWTLFCDTADSYNTYLSVNDQKPYAVQLPNNKNPLFQLIAAKVDNWKSRLLFNSLPSRVKSIKITYNQTPEHSFQILGSNGKFQIIGMANDDDVKLDAYVALFQNGKVKRYINNQIEVKNEIMKDQPNFAIEVEELDSTYNQTLNIYYNPAKYKKLYGIIKKTNELVILDPYYFDLLLQKRSFFEKK